MSLGYLVVSMTTPLFQNSAMEDSLENQNEEPTCLFEHNLLPGHLFPWHAMSHSPSQQKWGASPPCFKSWWASLSSSNWQVEESHFPPLWGLRLTDSLALYLIGEGSPLVYGSKWTRWDLAWAFRICSICIQCGCFWANWPRPSTDNIYMYVHMQILCATQLKPPKIILSMQKNTCNCEKTSPFVNNVV